VHDGDDRVSTRHHARWCSPVGSDSAATAGWLLRIVRLSLSRVDP
jgi:hypothetical protein